MKKKKNISFLDIVPVVILVVIFALFAILSQGKTMTAYNIKSLFTQVLPIAIGCLGVIFVVAIGSTDISVGASGALCATLAGIVAARTSAWLLIPLAMIFSTLVGLFIGFIVVRFKMDSFMTTLACLIAIKGLLNFVLTKGLVYAPAELGFVTSFQFAIILLVVVIAIVAFVFEKTRFGYICKCIGENEKTVNSVGVNVKRVRWICFGISGLMAGIFGFISLCRCGGATNTLCNMMEMKIQMAIFLGGVLVTGGFSSKLYKVIIGSVTIAVIENGLTVCQVPSTISEAVEGILLVIILCITIYCNTVSLKKSERDAVMAEHALLQEEASRF